MATFGKLVALRLGLANPESYTSHCWRRSAATTMANSGASAAQLQRKFGWANQKTCAEYVDTSMNVKLADIALLENKRFVHSFHSI